MRSGKDLFPKRVHHKGGWKAIKKNQAIVFDTKSKRKRKKKVKRLVFLIQIITISIQLALPLL